MNLGFIGTDEITVAMVTGFCAATPGPERIFVSPRNATKAAALAAAFPIVEVGADNQAVVELFGRIGTSVEVAHAAEFAHSGRSPR